MPGENGAVDIVAALVQCHQHGFLRDCGRNCGRFLGNPPGGVARPAFRNFMDHEAAKSEFAANIIEAFAVAFRQFPLRALL